MQALAAAQRDGLGQRVQQAAQVVDLPAYKRFHADVLGCLPQVSMITSYIVMDSPKDERG